MMLAIMVREGIIVVGKEWLHCSKWNRSGSKQQSPPQRFTSSRDLPKVPTLSRQRVAPVGDQRVNYMSLWRTFYIQTTKVCSYILFICSSLDGHIICFHLSTILNNTAIYLEVRWLYPVVIMPLTNKKLLTFLYYICAPFSHPPVTYEYSVSSFPSQTCYFLLLDFFFFFFDNSHHSECVIIFYCLNVTIINC